MTEPAGPHAGLPSAPLLAPGGTVLVVDDEQPNLDLAEAILEDAGFTVRLARDGDSALAEVERQAPDCIVLDLMMPGLNGFQVCQRIKSRRATRFVPVVMLTALKSVDDKVAGLEYGADDFLTKPVLEEELVARVSALVKIKRLRDELDSSEDIVVSMVEALEAKDPSHAGHAERVAFRAVRLARHLDLDDELVEQVAKAAILHDLGKIGLPERLLPKHQPLGDDDRALLRRHPEMAEEILSPLLTFAPVRAMIRHHHERLDGSGYPDGIAGDAFGLPSEIVAIANHYDDLREGNTDAATAASMLRLAASRGEFRRDTVEALIGLEGARQSGRDARRPDWRAELPPVRFRRDGCVLVGTGDATFRQAVAEVLEDEGHRVVQVTTGDEVREAATQVWPDLILLGPSLGAGNDRSNDNSDGADSFERCARVCADVKAADPAGDRPFLPLLVASKPLDDASRRRAVEVGVDDFLALPLHRLELRSRVRSLLRLHLYFKDLEEFQNVILSLASALEAKDSYTRGHSERVGALAARVAKQMGLGEEAMNLLKVAGQLHDIGKIGVPEALLNKPGKLTDDEFAVVQSHSVRGEEICRNLRSAQAVLPAIRHHHERCDGSGYPDRLAGDDIPLDARIIGVADAYDALTSWRTYRENLTPRAAVELLRQETERGKWDRSVFSALERVVRRSMG